MVDNEQSFERQPRDETPVENIAESLQEGLVGKLSGMLPEGALDKAADILPEGALSKATAMLDRDGDGNAINDLASFFLDRR